MRLAFINLFFSFRIHQFFPAIIRPLLYYTGKKVLRIMLNVFTLIEISFCFKNSVYRYFSSWLGILMYDHSVKISTSEILAGIFGKFCLSLYGFYGMVVTYVFCHGSCNYISFFHCLSVLCDENVCFFSLSLTKNFSKITNPICNSMITETSLLFRIVCTFYLLTFYSIINGRYYNFQKCLYFFLDLDLTECISMIRHHSIMVYNSNVTYLAQMSNLYFSSSRGSFKMSINSCHFIFQKTIL